MAETQRVIRRVVVLCDGTWCGRETKTESNIYMLAKMIGVNLSGTLAEAPPSPYLRARYFDGVGLGGDFMSYLWNGALATQAKREWTEVYNFIVQNFDSDSAVQTEIWMFGISRGAYMARSVAGMINNCGIIKDKTNQRLINQVYDIYQSPHPVDRPWSEEMKRFRKKASHSVSRPIKFMGLFDTVGSRGIPRLNYNNGSGFEWYQARDLKIRQKWFPGCHYDIARQEFQFFREGGNSLENILFPILNRFNKIVSPNGQLADLVLLWMLEGIRTVGGGKIIQKDMNDGERDITGAIAAIRNRIIQFPLQRRGSGDMYDDILSYLPGGKILARFKNLNMTAYAIIFNPVDRVIPDPGLGNSPQSAVYNEVYDYTAPDVDINNVIIRDSAEISRHRYPSRTYWNYRTYMKTLQLPPRRWRRNTL